MRRVLPLVIVGLGMCVVGSGESVSAQSEPQVATAAEELTGAQHFTGLWAYSAEHSINASTGRPERGGRGAPAPRPAITRATPAAPTTETRGESSPFAPSPQSMRENRDMMRDLLEIAETLEFAVSDGTVTITDDLERLRTFNTDGSRQRTRLGASEFTARVRWDGNRLRRDIEGSFGFRMTETYFLSPDANRLFVILRVGNTVRGRRPVGADRVYDRVSPENQ
jgi:hypothetical protein